MNDDVIFWGLVVLAVVAVVIVALALRHKKNTTQPSYSQTSVDLHNIGMQSELLSHANALLKVVGQHAETIAVQAEAHARTLLHLTGGTYTVQLGDTLFGIAAAHGLDMAQLAAWNGITNPDKIQAGQVLRLTEPRDLLLK